MKKLLIGSLLLFTTLAHSVLLHQVTGREGDVTNTLVLEPCQYNFKREALNVCIVIGVSTTSLPTFIVENSIIDIESPETMAGLVDGEEKALAAVSVHFDVTTDKIRETVSSLYEAGVEINLENIGNNL